MKPTPLPETWLQLPRKTRDAALRILIERRLKLGDSNIFSLIRANRGEPVPASLEQSFFLEMQDRFGGRLAWTMAAPPIILENVDPENIREAIITLATRHDVLHSTFKRSATGFLMMTDDSRTPPFSHRKLPLTVAVTGAENWVRKRYEEFLTEPFDPENGLLWRAELCTFGSRGVLLLSFCSAIVDGESIHMIDHDLRNILNAATPKTEPKPIFDYADYAATQAKLQRNGQFDAALNWWQERLTGGPPAAWKDDRRPIAPSHLYEQVIGAKTGAALDAIAAAHHTTPPVVMLAEFMALLHEMDGTDDLWVASASASRDIPGTETMVGTFARQALLRLPWKPDRDLIADVHTTLIETMDQPAVPHLLVRRALEKAYPAAPSAFRYVFNYREVPPGLEAGIETGDVAFQRGPLQATSAREEDILFMVMQTGETRRVHWYLRSDRFSPQEAENLLRRFMKALHRRLAEKELQGS